MSQEATCSVCAENYDNSARCPRVLRCGHTLCQSCLGRIIRGPAAKACPECRFQIKPNRTADFPKNYALLQLFPAIPAEPVAAPCDDTGCGGGAVEANASAPRRKRRRGGRRRLRSELRDLVSEFANAWHRAHGDWQSCGCAACAEWPHGIGCRCDQCNEQMEQRGVKCVVCSKRYDGWGWPFGYCSRGCWGEHSLYIANW